MKNNVRVPVSLYRALLQAVQEGILASKVADRAPEDEIEVTRRQLLSMMRLIVKHPESDVSSYYLSEITRLLKGSGEQEYIEDVPVIGGYVKENGWLLETTYNPVLKETRLAVRKPLNQITSQKEVRLEGVRLLPLPATNPLISSRKLVLPTELWTTKISVPFFVKAIQQYLYDYVDIEPWFRDFAAWYAVYTWLHDSWQGSPINLHICGAPSTGKTLLLQVLGDICYRPVMDTGVQRALETAALLDRFGITPVTTLLDSSPDLPNDPEHVYRILERQVMMAKGPKITVTRSAMKDLPANCIQYQMFQTKRPDIPEYLLTGDFRYRSQRIRDALLNIRMHYSSPLQIGFRTTDIVISRRMAKGLKLLLAEENVSDLIDEMAVNMPGGL